MAYLKIDFFSEVLNRAMQMGVILPEADITDERLQGYKNIPFSGQEKLPVLYLLHGLTDNYTTWLRNTSIERYASERGIAVILPEGYLGFYTDMYHGYSYYTYLTEELPAIVRKALPCISRRREDTFVAGNSMGAYGALMWSVRHPESIACAGLFSGSYHINIEVLNNKMGFPVRYWEDVFGEIKSFVGSNNDPEIAVEQHRNDNNKPRIYMWTGNKDWLLYSSRRMSEKLLKNGYDVLYRETDGDHSWADWDAQIVEYLNWLPLERR